MQPTDEKLIDFFKELFHCDSARISAPTGRMFLIIGYRRSTKDDVEGYWMDESGCRRDWEYLDEKCIASGDTKKELVDSANDYKRLLDLHEREFETRY